MVSSRLSAHPNYSGQEIHSPECERLRLRSVPELSFARELVETAVVPKECRVALDFNTLLGAAGARRKTVQLRVSVTTVRSFMGARR